MFRKLINERAKRGNKTNDVQNILIGKEDTGIPVNLPCAIIGDKGSGKTTLVKTLMDQTQRKIFQHIYFIYSNLSFDDSEDSFVTKVNVDQSEDFLTELFRIKSIFFSYSNLIMKLKKITEDENRKTDKASLIDDFLKCCDTTVVKENSTDINKLQYYMKFPTRDFADESNNIIDGIISKATKTVSELRKPFQILNVKINGISLDERDAIIIDDIAIAAKILFKQMKESSIYKYLTLTRHMRLFILFSGQQIDQIPKFIRREIMCWLFSKNTSLELLKGIIPIEKIKEIERNQAKLDRYEFVCYSFIDGRIKII